MTSVSRQPIYFQSPEVRVVEASAGSGKTYALAKRYVQLILNPQVALEEVPIRGVLALTFTNKAAFEMKARILEFLKRTALRALSQEEEKDILTSMGADKDQASLKAFAVMEAIIRQYNFFQVQTIDKFINALLSGCALKIGLTANFRIKTNSKEYLQYSLDQLVDQAGSNAELKKTFERFLRHYIYLENRSGWFPKEDILSILTALFNQHNMYGLPFHPGGFSPDEVVKKKKKILEQMSLLRGMLPDGTLANFLKSLDKFLGQHSQGFDVDAVSDYFAREEVPVRKGVEVPSGLGRLWREIQTDLRTLCHMEARSLFGPYIEIFERTIEGFHALAAGDDCLFLSELNKKASLLFSAGQVSVEELYYRLATRFHHYLIDEFQDTSRLQWNNLQAMTEEALSTGGTLFYVGDRKQAIYGFRGGDEGLFDDVKERFRAFHVGVDHLTNNWRSRKEIVEFNNTVFSPDNLHRFLRAVQEQSEQRNAREAIGFNSQDFLKIKRIFQTARQTYQEKNQGGRVSLAYIDADGKDETDRRVRQQLTALVHELSQRYSFREIAILTRGNAQVKDITNWLLESGIPVDSERTLDIKENTLIRELLALLRFLDSPIDNGAFSDFILGDLFAGATGLSKGHLGQFVMDHRARLANENGFYLYTEFRQRYRVVWDAFIDEFFRNVGLYPLYELLVTVYARFKVLDNAPGSQGFFMHFLELVKGAEEEYPDITSFLEYFESLEGEDLYVPVVDSDAVKVMTIHKSKGLEFPVVILPHLVMDIQIGSSGGEYQPSYVMRLEDNDALKLLRIKKKYGKFSEELAEIYAQEYKKALFAELNNLYVALTRAKLELHGFIPKKTGQSINIARFLIPEDCFSAGTPQRPEPAKPTDEVILEIPPSNFPNWIDYLRDEFLQTDHVRGRAQRRKGEVIHYLLSFIGNLSGRDPHAMARGALEQGRAQFLDVRDWSVYQAELEAVLSAPGLRKFFFCESAEVGTEKDLVDSSGRAKRCDRLIMTPTQVWVVDYKSSRDFLGRSVQQLEEYRRIMEGIYPQRTIKGFFIFLDTKDAEELKMI